METTNIISIIYGGNFRSYPTYEEWKQPKIDKIELPHKSSYPTYEEWKHLFHLRTI